MVNFGLLTAEIGSGVWGTLANFNWLCVLASLLQWCRSPRPIKLCMMFGCLLGCYTMYTFSGAFASWRNFARFKFHFASKSCILLYCQRYCKALQQRASAKLCGVVQEMELQNLHRRRHLYSAGRPSRWESAHILVLTVLLDNCYPVHSIKLSPFHNKTHNKASLPTNQHTVVW